MGRITEAMVQLRRRVTEVDVLILEDNNIPHLPSRAFGSVKINRLFIENNRIKTIDRNAFAGIEDFLTELYIKVSERMSYNYCKIFIYACKYFTGILMVCRYFVKRQGFHTKDLKIVACLVKTTVKTG